MAGAASTPPAPTRSARLPRFCFFIADLREGLSRIGTIVSDLRSFCHPETVIATSCPVAEPLQSAVRLLAAPMPSAAQQPKTLKVVMHADVRTLDPFWTTQTIAGIHGMMVYDTLFSIDEKFEVKPQMVDTWKTSDDGLVWTFALRDGLEWHDGKPVTAEDCVASLKRWSVKDAAGQMMTRFTKELAAVDAKTVRLSLSEPFGLVIDCYEGTPQRISAPEPTRPVPGGLTPQAPQGGNSS